MITPGVGVGVRRKTGRSVAVGVGDIVGTIDAVGEGVATGFENGATITYAATARATTTSTIMVFFISLVYLIFYSMTMRVPRMIG